jgi:putative transcriptional regulator
MTTAASAGGSHSLCRFVTGLSLPLSILIFSYLLALPAFVHAEEQPPSTSPLAIKKGTFLIAHPSLMDPNFQQTVVLICEHGEEGTLGLIINRPTELLLSDVLPAIPVLKGTSYVLYAGGPVQPEGVVMLFRVVEAAAHLRKVMERVYLGLSREALERVITQPQPTETFRAYAGYAGWAPGQLEFEMGMGSWAVVPADPASIFDKAPEALWSEMVEALHAPRIIRQN